MKMKASNSKERFDLCDDITSSYMEGFCSGISSELLDQKINSTIDAIIKKWPDTERVVFKNLRKSATAFFELRAGWEVDQSGTARVAMVNEESDSLNNNFFEKTRQADKCNFTAYSKQQFEEADKQLNAVYQQLMKGKEFEEHKGITKEGVKTNQQSWITYRDAWVNFLAVRCPKLSASSIKTLLTKERISQLKELVELQEGF